ncbi:divergent polysaccharide deacetylase family protein [Glycocaulis sp.]
MSNPATSFIYLASAAAACILMCAGLAFELGQKAGEADAPEIITVSAPERPAAQVREAPAARPEPASDRSVEFASGLRSLVSNAPVLAVIIDDIGPDREAAEALIALDIPLTLSILPFAREAGAIAHEAASVGLDVFLHLPMEPVGLDDPGPNALTRHLSEAEMERRALWALSRVPGAMGFNNHMGSAMTRDEAALRRAFAHFAGRDLVFVDSLTHPASRAAHIAAEAGMQALRRDVFLDHVRSPEAVDAALEHALRLAAERGAAIAIGHPYPVTLEALEGLAERAAEHGVELVGMSALAARERASEAS